MSFEIWQRETKSWNLKIYLFVADHYMLINIFINSFSI